MGQVGELCSQVQGPTLQAGCCLPQVPALCSRLLVDIFHSNLFLGRPRSQMSSHHPSSQDTAQDTQPGKQQGKESAKVKMSHINSLDMQENQSIKFAHDAGLTSGDLHFRCQPFLQISSVLQKSPKNQLYVAPKTTPFTFPIHVRTYIIMH